jgi:hypothetical protein
VVDDMYVKVERSSQLTNTRTAEMQAMQQLADKSELKMTHVINTVGNNTSYMCCAGVVKGSSSIGGVVSMVSGRRAEGPFHLCTAKMSSLGLIPFADTHDTFFRGPTSNSTKMFLRL